MALTLGQQLEKDIRDANYSVRGFAAELQKRKPREGGLESWRGTVKRYVRDKEQPGPENAMLLADVLGKAHDYYLRLPRRETLREANERLRLENEELSRRWEDRESAKGADDRE